MEEDVETPNLGNSNSPVANFKTAPYSPLPIPSVG